jgi:hypothetical protein
MPYTDIFFISSMFLEPIRAASYRGHTEIVKLLMVDHSDGALHSNNCSTIPASKSSAPRETFKKMNIWMAASLCKKAELA